MTNLELRIESWHENNFGQLVKLPETYCKLLEEVGELGEALMKSDTGAVQEEVGDCALVLAHIIRGACPDHPSLVVKMRVTDAGPSNLSVYLALMRREIERRRSVLTKVEPLPHGSYHPRDINEFVLHMAESGMFIFAAMETTLTNEPNTSGDKKVSDASRKAHRKRKRKHNNPPIG